MRKSKSEFFGSLNETDLCDNKKFWSVVKPLLSNRVVYNERITLAEDDKILENDKNTASVLQEFFSNIITTPGIPQYNETEPVSHNVGDPLMKVIMKYRFYPSTVIVTRVCLLVSLRLNVMKKKLITLRQIKPHKAQTYPQNVLRKTLIFLEILFLEIIIIAFLIHFSKLLEKCNHNTSS